MANEEQLSILKQGPFFWNKWRDTYPNIEIDLYGTDLRDIDLREVDLRGANISYTHLRTADLRKTLLSGANLAFAELNGADLMDVNLSDVDFSAARLIGANLTGAKLQEANLNFADLRNANLRNANLRKANLKGAGLIETNFIGTRLSEANFTDVMMGDTVFANLDLGRVVGLENIDHRAPSSISTDVLAHSRGKIPEIFLRGCGLSDTDIEYAKLYSPDLSNDEKTRILYNLYDLQANHAIQMFPLFISYSHGDSAFVDKLESQLNASGIRFWRDIHEMKAGRIETQIDRAISQNRTVLLVLSEHSLSSDWVEHEVRTARELEKYMGRDVLCPVALDDSWKSSHWPKRIMEQIMEYNILDFSAWEDDSKFEGMFRKLIDGLELFYKG